MQVVTGKEMRRIDEVTIDRYVAGITLMERAGQRIFEVICREFDPVEELTVSIFLGRGNNAGDGLVVARLLLEKSARVHLHYLHEPKDFSPDAFKNYSKLSNYRRQKMVAENFLYLADWEQKVAKSLEESDIIVDALLGTGIAKPVKESYAAVIKVMNDGLVPIVAVDMPSGVHADTGEIMGTAVDADLTVTLGLIKIGALFYPGRAFVGDLIVGDIGIPPEVIEAEGISVHLLDIEQAFADLPGHQMTAHKFSRGSLLIIAGSRRYAGAAFLASVSALRTGCGIVYLAGPESIRSSIQSAAPEIIFVSQPETASGSIAFSALENVLEEVRFDAIAIGPGLTTEGETVRLVQELVARCPTPVLIDADGINAFEGAYQKLMALAKDREVIVSPHSGELKRLTGTEIPESPPTERIDRLRSLIEGTDMTLVHKGAPTIVVHPNGHAYVNACGHPGQATAGSGDVLTGAIAGFLAQGCGPARAARAGVYLHSHAADIASFDVGERGMIAGDCMDALGSALREVEMGEW